MLRDVAPLPRLADSMAALHNGDMPRSPESSPAKPHRRWFQFSLRTLLIFVTLAAGLAVAWRACVEPYRRQRQTMALIERLGGSYQATEPAGWLRRLSGDRFQKVVLVNLADCAEPDAYINAVADLPALETLVVGRPAFSDQHLRRLHGLKTLRGLVLDSTNVTKEGVSALSDALPQLEVYQSQRWVIATLREWGSVVADVNTAHADLQRLLGVEWIEEAVQVGLENSPAPSDVIAQISRLHQLSHLDLRHTKLADGVLDFARLTKLQQLELSGTLVGDAGLTHLDALGQLQYLDLAGTQVSDATLGRLPELKRLRHLDLGSTRVTDAELTWLGRLPQLRRLYLDGTQVSDAGLASLRGARQLEVLSLEHTQVGGAGLAHLKDLPHLWVLSLAETRVSDSALASLKAFKELGWLDLNGTQVGDAGLAHLQSVPELRMLFISETRVTAEGLARFRAARPKCRVRSVSANE